MYHAKHTHTHTLNYNPHTHDEEEKKKHTNENNQNQPTKIYKYMKKIHQITGFLLVMYACIGCVCV